MTYSNGNATDYSYNLANKLDQMTNKKGTTALSKYTYCYYLNGNQSSKTDLSNKVTSYVYDGLCRLKSEAEAGSANFGRIRTPCRVNKITGTL